MLYGRHLGAGLRILYARRHTSVVHIERVRTHHRVAWQIRTAKHDAGIRCCGAYQHFDAMAEMHTDAGGANFVLEGALLDHDNEWLFNPLQHGSNFSICKCVAASLQRKLTSAS